MTKSITLGTILCLLTVFFTLSFKSADNEKKDYVAISYTTSGKDISLSYSNGTYKVVEYQKTQGFCDQTQILKLINEQEALGYKLVNYDTEFQTNSSAAHMTTVLLSK
jgi:hypothetical protein